MKTSTFKLVAILVLSVVSSIAKADYTKHIHNGWAIEKVKALQLDTKFSNITFISTRTDSVTVDIEVGIENLTGKKAENIIDQISFKLSLSNGTVVVKTDFSYDFRTKQNFTIDINVNIPIDRDLNVTNKYGNVSMGNLQAEGIFEIAYGSISGEDFQAPEGSKIKLEIKYGKGIFESINRISADISYSPLSIDAIDEATIESRYSVISIDKCNQLNSNSRYDAYKIDEISKLTSESRFSQWNIDRLTQSIELDTEYGGIDIDYVEPSFELIDIKNRYGGIKASIDADASYQLTGEGYYCKIKHPQTDNGTIEKDKNHYSVKTNVGNSDPKSKVIIESKYGGVDLME